MIGRRQSAERKCIGVVREGGGTNIRNGLG